MKLRRKPVQVDAVQWDGHNVADVEMLIGQVCHIEGRVNPHLGELVIPTDRGHIYVCQTDWVVLHDDGKVGILTDHTVTKSYDAIP